MTKSKYVAGLKQLYWEIENDWSIEEARGLYNKLYPSFHHANFYRDCIEGMKNLKAESIDLIIADPPFGLEFDGKYNAYNRDKEFVKEGYIDVEPAEYEKFSRKWIAELPRIMKPKSSIYIFSGYNNLHHVLNALEETELTKINHLIWSYSFGVPTTRKFVTNYYHVLFLVKDPKKYFFNRIEWYPKSTFKINRKYKKGQLKNGTCLPREVVKRLMDFSSKPGDLVLDPFLGNGTTAVVAKANFRKSIGFEKNQVMKEIIEHNLKNTRAGESYTPYNSRKPTIKELAKKYPKAYEIYNKDLKKDLKGIDEMLRKKQENFK